ncbi:predicted protein [Arabidopsis lyrata subsp. lyrata]|uniref:ADP-ribosyl cyclase/cyclic ADP-ribose hydrolase n=1 Tax=Arabidopsis lyrata subsp. lyrata TaxID=81972 RepID=D7LXN6_ARALL|nr:predicted protein [Arabidopsis lyrata subsp. lyrata]
MASSGKPSQDQVFINFRGVELRYNFVSHLKKGLKRNGINAFIDTDEDMGQELNILLKRIEGSKIALAIFSPRYTESDWCLKELAKMKECREQGKLVVIPIFYKVEPSTVKRQKGEFGDNFRDLVEFIDEETKNNWTEALKSIPLLTGFVLNENSDEDDLIFKVVKEVKKALNIISRAPPNRLEGTVLSSTVHQKKLESSCGVDLRLKQLEEKLSFGFEDTTRIIGVVGMPGIGKTTLVKKLYEKLKNEFLSHVLILDIHETSREQGLSYLPTILLEDLLKVKNPMFETVQAAHEGYKDQLLKTKSLVILDHVSNKEQIAAILGKCDWIKQGSKIVIATGDTSLIHDLVDDIYQVPQLSYKDSLQQFTHYAIGDQSNAQSFLKLSIDFVHYTKGNPLALKVLGAELLGKDESLWNSKLDSLSQHHKGRARSSRKIRAQSSSEMLQSVWKECYDGLSQQQQDTLLDIACFRSLDKNYVASLLDSHDANSTEARIEIEKLMNKFLITISAGKIEMHDTLHMFCKEVGREATAPDGKGRRRLWDYHTIIDVLENNKGVSVRSIFLDLADLNMNNSLHSQAFNLMSNIRFLKIYNTCCPQECDRDIMLKFPDGLELPFDELRCLHWLKFPLKELPPDFDPKNLVDLKLHYSEIERVWEGNKDASKLKWIDFNHSRKLYTLSGLAEARNLQELNLEGCIALATLPQDMENMKCLVFLNLRGCTSLKYLPEINLISLETLILSDCSKFKVFKVISEKLEAIYLDGTAIKELPSDIRNLQRLVLLNMKGCKKLKTLPDSLGELKALQELILSGCSKLQSFPEVAKNMNRLEILLLDETAIKEMPNIFSLRYLCLSRNEKICRLPENISQFSRLKWLDMKYCKSLTYLPKLPPNLQCLDAHGCSSLKSIVQPLAHVMATEHIHSTFIFTKCDKLEQAAKEEISSYSQRKCQILPSALKLCNKDLVPEILFSTCFPGGEIPPWFYHQAIGSKVKFESPQHWKYNKLSGIAFCAVVSFQNCQDQTRTEREHTNCLSVKFTCTSTTDAEPCTETTWKVGSWTEQGNNKDTTESDHVFIGFTTCLHLRKHLEDQHSSQCAPIVAIFEFSVSNDNTSGEARFEVLKSGFSFVFEPDENKTTIINETPRTNGYLVDQANGVTNHKMSNGRPSEAHFYTTLQQG